MNGQMRAQPNSRLMNLPTEIRRMIWRAVLTPENRVITVVVKTLEASNGSPSTDASFSSILACKQMFSEAKGFLSAGMALDIMNKSNCSLRINEIISNQRCLDFVHSAFYNLSPTEEVEDVEDDDDNEDIEEVGFSASISPECELLTSVLALPTLETIAFRTDDLWGLEYQSDMDVWTYDEIRNNQISRQADPLEHHHLYMLVPGDDPEDYGEIKIDDLVRNQPHLRVILDYHVVSPPGCGGNCEEFKKNSAEQLKVEGEEDFEYPDYELREYCDCEDSTEWYAVASRKPNVTSWEFIECPDEKLRDDIFDEEAFAHMA